MEKEKYLGRFLLVTYLSDGSYDMSWYDDYDEALEDFDPLSFRQELYKAFLLRD